MWEVKASSLENVHLSKQYLNMPDSMRKRLLLKQLQVFEQSCQVLWKSQVNNWGHRIESARGKNQVACTNIYSFCSIKMQLYQTIKIANYINHIIIYGKYSTHFFKNWRKTKLIQTIANNILTIHSKKLIKTQ